MGLIAIEGVPCTPVGCPRQRWRGLIRGVLIAILLAPGAALAALPPEVQKGLDWLADQVQADGSVRGEEGAVATVPQTRAEVAVTLARLASAPAALRNGLTNAEFALAELDARKAIALGVAKTADATSITRLKALQNSDGGFASHEGGSSAVLDTAWALMALKAQEPFANPENAVASALNYLKQQRQQNAGWGLPGQPQVYVTALVMLAAQDWRTTHQVTDITSAGKDWLLAQASNSGDTSEDAVALMALARQTSEPTVLQPLVEALRAKQSADGSWEGDPFLTAAVLRALWLATTTQPEPSTGAVAGNVVDETSGLPLEGVAILLRSGSTSLSSTTDSVGHFIQAGLMPGAYAVELTKTGYQVWTASATVSAGVTAHLGTARLKPASAAVTVMGNVRDQWANPVVGVLVSAATTSASTDTRGAYVLQGLAPGNLQHQRQRVPLLSGGVA